VIRNAAPPYSNVQEAKSGLGKNRAMSFLQEGREILTRFPMLPEEKFYSPLVGCSPLCGEKQIIDREELNANCARASELRKHWYGQRLGVETLAGLRTC